MCKLLQFCTFPVNHVNYVSPSTKNMGNIKVLARISSAHGMEHIKVLMIIRIPPTTMSCELSVIPAIPQVWSCYFFNIFLLLSLTYKKLVHIIKSQHVIVTSISPKRNMCNFFIFLCFLQLKDPGRQMLQNVYRALKKVYHVNFMLTKFSPLNSEKSFNMKQKKKVNYICTYV